MHRLFFWNQHSASNVQLPKLFDEAFLGVYAGLFDFSIIIPSVSPSDGKTVVADGCFRESSRVTS
jgi:hypothetical protein